MRRLNKDRIDTTAEYTTAEVAYVLDVSEETVRRWANRRLIKHRKTGIGHFRFVGDHILDFLRGDKFQASELHEKQATGANYPQEYVSFALFGDEIKIVSLTTDGKYRLLDDAQNLHNILYIASSETLALQIAVEELETLVNDPKSKEKDFQDFFERYPDFVLNDQYKNAHSHIVLVEDNGNTLIPDFVLEPIDQNGLCDLLELKLPSAQVFVLKQRRMRFSAAVLEACAQLREYSAFFDEEKNRRKVKKKYGLLAYRPRMFVIIGRRGDINPITIRRMESDIPDLNIHTYDELIIRMRNRVESMKKGIQLI